MITVSIVEDLPEIRQGLSKLVSSQEDICLGKLYNNGELAVYDIPENPVDVVLMDINLPGMNGIECIRRLKSICPETQFMIFTIYENDDKIFSALQAGASGYILKKTEPNEILNAIRELHSGGSPMNSSIARKLVNIFQSKTDKQVSEEAAVLTKREMEIIGLLSKGFLYKEIADKTGISFGTVRQHCFRIYEKLHVHNKTEAINKVYKNRVSS
jgi:DNA-binding NarL/FixJ family response regulator